MTSLLLLPLIPPIIATIRKAIQENRPEQPDRERHYINRAFVYDNKRSLR